MTTARHDTATETTLLCDARRKKGAGRCTRPAGWGTSHLGVGRCKLHCGGTPTHDIAAAKANLARMAGFIDTSKVLPHEALMMCVQITAGEVLYATRQVAVLPEALAEVNGRLHPWIVVRQQAMDLCARVSRMAMDAGVPKLQKEMAEMSGEQIVTAMRAALAGTRLSEGQEQRLRSNLETYLRSLERRQ
jgi:hypothetical protein